MLLEFGDTLGGINAENPSLIPNMKNWCDCRHCPGSWGQPTSPSESLRSGFNKRVWLKNKAEARQGGAQL